MQPQCISLKQWDTLVEPHAGKRWALRGEKGTLPCVKRLTIVMRLKRRESITFSSGAACSSLWMLKYEYLSCLYYSLYLTVPGQNRQRLADGAFSVLLPFLHLLWTGGLRQQLAKGNWYNCTHYYPFYFFFLTAFLECWLWNRL